MNGRSDERQPPCAVAVTLGARSEAVPLPRGSRPNRPEFTDALHRREAGSHEGDEATEELSS